jgi:alpha-1,3-rhamnosyl/mannosyltransferase
MRLAPSNLGWSLIDLPRSVSREPLDVFHSPSYTAPLRAVHPLVLTIHDVSYERHPEWYPYRRDPIRRWFYRRSATVADLVITDSNFSKNEICAAYGLDPSRISVVPLAVGEPFAGWARDPGQSRLQTPYLLHVGDLHPRRNLGLVIRGLARLTSLARGTAVPALVLVGTDLGERSTLEEEARRAQVVVQFLSGVDDTTLATLYADAEALVYPSRYEGFGLPVLEAMACGTPVIAARAGAIPEVLGDAGILVNPDDDGELALAIACMITEPDRAKRLRDSGRERARLFTWDRTAALTLETYRAAIGRSRLGRG